MEKVWVLWERDGNEQRGRLLGVYDNQEAVDMDAEGVERWSVEEWEVDHVPQAG